MGSATAVTATSTRTSTAAAERYTRPAVALHWLMALGLVGSIGVGLYMVELPFSPQRLKLYNWHKWAGILLLTLAVLRLLWRLTHRPPADLPMPAWQRLGAHGVHAALYALMFVVPLLGWAYSSAAGYPVVMFGVLPLPDWVHKDKALADLIKPWHAWMAWSLTALIVLHIAAGLKHHLIDRDGLLRRMR
jgi:cytochrome b561